MERRTGKRTTGRHEIVRRLRDWRNIARKTMVKEKVGGKGMKGEQEGG